MPNCIQSTVNPDKVDLEDAHVDLVFNEFIQTYIMLALKYLGLDYSDADVLKYMSRKDFTTLLAHWISLNWDTIADGLFYPLALSDSKDEDCPD